MFFIKLVTTKSCDTWLDSSCSKSYQDQTNHWQNSMKEQKRFYSTTQPWHSDKHCNCLSHTNAMSTSQQHPSLHMNSVVPHIRNGSHRLDHMTEHINYRQINDGSVNEHTKIKKRVFNNNNFSLVQNRLTWTFPTRSLQSKHPEVGWSNTSLRMHGTPLWIDSCPSPGSGWSKV